VTTTEIATQDKTPSALIATYTDDFRTVLPATIRPETFVRLAQGVLRRDPKLMEGATNNPGSLMVALLDSARLGHEPGTEDFYLVPRKRKGRLEVQGIEGYRGIVKRMLNSGIVLSVVAETVCENDTFDFIRGVNDRPRHVIDFFGERGALKGAYAYAVMAGGATSQVVVVGPKEIAEAKASSEGASSDYSPWKKHQAAMYRKTALRRLEPFVAKSSVYTAALMDRSVEAAQVAESHDLPALPPHDPDTGEVHDAEIVEDTGHAFLYDPQADDGTCATCGVAEPDHA
jgi:recombination protein RecT